MELRPDYWRDMAVQYRRSAGETRDKVLGARMLKLAEDCDALATRQEEILQHSNGKGSSAENE